MMERVAQTRGISNDHMGLEVKPPNGPFPTLYSLVHLAIMVHPIIMDVFN